MTITVQMFAGLKDYFNPLFEMNWEQGSMETLKAELIAHNPKSAGLLHRCRFAVNEEFIGLNYIIKSNDHVAIIPPSSGG